MDLDIVKKARVVDDVSSTCFFFFFKWNRKFSPVSQQAQNFFLRLIVSDSGKYLRKAAVILSACDTA